MPSFLSKVFGRKKDEKASQSPRRGSGGSLLDGKFEAVSPTVSPSATDFLENPLKGNGKDKDKDGAFNTLRVKSRPSSQDVSQKKKDDLPQLSLVLPASNEQAVLGVAFEADPNGQVLSDAALGNRRLNPSEALILVRACSQAIIATGMLIIFRLRLTLNLTIAFTRAGNPRDHAPSLVFCFTRRSTQAHFAFHTLFGSSNCNSFPELIVIHLYFRVRTQLHPITS